MGVIQEHPPVKYFAAIAFKDHNDLDEVLKGTETLFSGIEQKSEIYLYDDYTDYYAGEMGEGLHKLFVVYTNHEKPEWLADKKVLTNMLETRFMNDNNNRKVNIDPGYISLSGLILATTKNFSHRIYLGKGIYGDLHLMFSRKSFQVMPWTYPDYKAHIDFFNKIRNQYYGELYKK
ncbi:MAG: DUF4416 family protein [Calditrichaceae bacterium]|nr:DUF4416 family protein [Calditrichaceae bacterium]MBN2708807.1 DUF4416 family protein [Calditrichaceae bacterium]RQV97664.1 MAG: DUF4416 family protein [Calditrichota bacterium]